MQTPLLQEFMGVSDEDFYEDTTPLEAQIEVTVHDTAEELLKLEEVEEDLFSELRSLGEDIRTPRGGALNPKTIHDGNRVRVGKIVVPILTGLGQRSGMFAKGAYPGVEYRILRILDSNGQDRFTSAPGCEYEIRPIYPLVAQLERQWPVRVNERDIPRLYTSTMYNIVSAFGSLAAATTFLGTAFFLSQAISFFYIPSLSMDPTLHVGDVLLVDKVSPRLFQNQRPGDVVLFSPPSALQQIVADNGGRLSTRDLFVKRIAAQGGDAISVDTAGKVQINGNPAPGRRDLCQEEPLRLIEKYVKAKDEVVGKDEVYVLGDCSSVSVDSRVWGPLQKSSIVGRPVLRIWPLDSFGPVPALQSLTTTADNWDATETK